MKKIAIIGGGIAGITAAYDFAKLAREGVPIEATLFESSSRLGGIVETTREGGFVIECGPDGWVTEKPWAHDLAIELGLEDELISSRDETRRTWILKDGALQAIPDGMSMMVPADLNAIDQSPLFTESAKQAYRNEPHRAAELKASAPTSDESIASFVRRHFGDEVLQTIAAPLLSGVLGGDVANLSVRAVMAPFVALEREYGSLITALQTREAARLTPKPTIFTSVRTGTATLLDRMIATIPQHWLHLSSSAVEIVPTNAGWTLQLSHGTTPPQHFDSLLLATPADITRALLTPLNPAAAALLEMDSSSAVVVAFALPDASRFPVPPGFGFLVPQSSGAHKNTSRLLACTFVDQKFSHRVPPGGRLIRAFFGGPGAERMMSCNNDEIASIARLELAPILGPLPDPQLTLVRRWPRSLPQYAVGHLDRMAALNAHVQKMPHLSLLGNAYRGVGLPDLIRDSRNAARTVAQNAVIA